MAAITGRQWLILLTVQFTTVLFGLTTTSVTVILPQLKGALSATADQISWILTFNLVATAVATPLTGWLAAKLGWRVLMICSVIGFTTASMACGMVSSLESLLVLRVIQGAFGAPIFPMGQTILLGSFERHQHPFIIMMWGVGGVMGPILGPTFGGMVAELFSWRWTFFLIVPMGILAGSMAAAALPDREKGMRRPLDFTGYMFLGIAIAAFQLMFDRGQRNDWFDSAEIVIECGLAVVFFSMFLIHMATTLTPLVEPATFADRNFVVGSTVAIIMGMLQYVPMVMFPPLLQELRGYPDGVIGLLVAARGLGNFGSFFIVAPLTRISPRVCLFTGFAIQAVAAIWMGSLDINLSTTDVMFTNMLHGLGFGLAYTPMAVLTFSTLPGSLLTQGNAVFALVRMLGSSIFISMSLLVFSQSVAEATVNLTSYITMLRIDALLPWTTTYGGLGNAATYDRLANEVQRQAGMIGYINAFHMMTLITICAAPLAFLFAPRGAAR